MTAGIGHNNPMPDLPSGFEVDYGHILMDRVFFHPDLKDMIDGDRLLLAAFGFGMKRGCAKIRMSIGYANALMGENISTTKDRFKRLRKLGWLKCIPGKGTRPSEWELDLPPTEIEAAVRRAVEAYNEQIDASGGTETPTMRLSGCAQTPTSNPSGCVGTPVRDQKQETPLSGGAETPTKETTDSASGWVGGPQWVCGDPPTNRTNIAASSRADSSSKDSTVVPLTDDAEWTRRKLEPFGNHGSDWARELATFLGIKIPEAVDRMETAARVYGHFNVVEAVREANATEDVRSPRGLFGSILKRLLREFGVRNEMPKPKVEPKATNGRTYRPLTMQQRTFYC